MLSLLKDLAVASLRAAVDRVSRALLGKLSEDDDDAMPLTHAHVEHNHRQERDAIAAAKELEARRKADTVPPPKPTKPGTLR